MSRTYPHSALLFHSFAQAPAFRRRESFILNGDPPQVIERGEKVVLPSLDGESFMASVDPLLSLILHKRRDRSLPKIQTRSQRMDILIRLFAVPLGVPHSQIRAKLMRRQPEVAAGICVEKEDGDHIADALRRLRKAVQPDHALGRLEGDLGIANDRAEGGLGTMATPVPSLNLLRRLEYRRGQSRCQEPGVIPLLVPGRPSSPWKDYNY